MLWRKRKEKKAVKSHDTSLRAKKKKKKKRVLSVSTQERGAKGGVCRMMMGAPKRHCKKKKKVPTLGFDEVLEEGGEERGAPAAVKTRSITSCLSGRKGGKKKKGGRDLDEVGWKKKSTASVRNGAERAIWVLA